MNESSQSELVQKSALLRVCYFGTYRANYSRNRILISGLRARGVIVYECHAKLWHGIEDRVRCASGGWARSEFLSRIWRAYRLLISKHRKVPEYDIMLIGYPGQLDSFLGRILSWRRRKPMMLDVLMSLHLVAKERGLTQAFPRTGRLIFTVEKYGLRLPDKLIAENEHYAQYMQNTFRLSKDVFRILPHGADEQIFRPRYTVTSERLFRVVYHGSFLVSHGLDTVAEAAGLLAEHPDIQFDFYGIGPEKKKIERMASRMSQRNMHFHGYVSTDQLLGGLSRASICLGVFGNTQQSLCTVQNKIWEGLAMAVPVVSGRSALVESMLCHREHIYLVDRGNAKALVEGILALKDDGQLRQRIALQGHQFFLQKHSTAAIGAKATELLLESAASDSKYETMSVTS